VATPRHILFPCIPEIFFKIFLLFFSGNCHEFSVICHFSFLGSIILLKSCIFYLFSSFVKVVSSSAMQIGHAIVLELFVIVV
jgi:hypothetical protein